MIVIFCIISGLFLGLSQPLYLSTTINNLSGFWHYSALLCLVGYVYPFMIANKKNIVQTFIATFFTSFIGFCVSLYWIYIAVHVYGHVAPISSIAITLALPAILAFKTAVFMSLAKILSKHFKVSFLWFAPIALCAAEFFRNYALFGGFPWANMGYSLGRIDEFLQLASIIGVYGLVFLVGLINALIVLIYEKNNYKLVFIPVILIIIIFLFGNYRLNNLNLNSDNNLKIALIQGNINQDEKNSKSSKENIFDIYKNLTYEAVNNNADLIIWPESSYPYLSKENMSEFEFAKQTNKAFVIGATTYGYDTKDKNGYHYGNSAFLINFNGQVLKRYDKSHLVPFGEYVPWPMGGIVQKIVPGMGAFKRGLDFTSTSLLIDDKKEISVGVSICYEGIFPEIARKQALEKPQILINITNDAWYGVSSAPYQHLLMYRLRAVESGQFYARATNSGVSAFIDPLGNIMAASQLFSREVIIKNINTNRVDTLYVRLGDSVPIVCLLIMLIGLLSVIFPLNYYLKNKKFVSLFLSMSMILVFLLATRHFLSETELLNESSNTKLLFIFLLCNLGILSIAKYTPKR